MKIRLPQGSPDQSREMLQRLSDVMRHHPGGYQSIVYLPPSQDHPKGSSFRTEPDLWVSPDEGFRREIIRLVGEDNFKV